MTNWAIELEEIEGGLVRGSHAIYGQSMELGTLEDDVIRAQIKALQKNQTPGILPPIVRWISPARRYAILERPPHTINVSYYGLPQARVHQAQLQEFTINLPWTIYCIGMDTWMRPIEVSVFATRHSLQSTGDQLFLLPLTNTYANGKFCLPVLPEIASGEIPEKPWSIGDGINAGFQLVWGSNFNTDIVDVPLNSYRHKRPNVFFPEDPNEDYMNVRPARLLRVWSELSVEEVAAIEDWPMPNDDNFYTVGGLMTDARAWESGRYNGNTLYNSLRLMFRD